MSIVDNRFPIITWRDGEKYLWNPIQKKALKIRPEERIRLCVIEHLLAAGWSKHRISTEEGIAPTKQGKLRTDLICYSRAFDPLLLVECKAPRVRISNQTAEQIARYNSNVEAPTLLMTNGRSDLWYSFQDKQPIVQKKVPKPFRANHQPESQPFEYWVKRGFTGKKAGPDLRKWLVQMLNETVYKTQHSFQYLSFKKTFSDVNLSHYYQITEVADHRIALAVVATAFGGTRLVAIKNKNGKNRALLEINLDFLFDYKSPNASLYHSGGTKNMDIRTQVDWEPEMFNFSTFSRMIAEIFDGDA